MVTADVDVRLCDLGSADAAALIRALNQELSLRYPEQGANHFRLHADEVAAESGAFLVAYAEGRPVGCGAIRRIAADTAEIKRMFVTPAARGRGISRIVLAALEAEARRLGVSRLVLETGARQAEALGLYRNAGYTPIEPFGEYVGSPLSICLGKRL